MLVYWLGHLFVKQLKLDLLDLFTAQFFSSWNHMKKVCMNNDSEKCLFISLGLDAACRFILCLKRAVLAPLPSRF